MTYLRWREAPPDLMDRIDAFYHYKFESKTLFDEQEVSISGTCHQLGGGGCWYN